ncbi:zinc-dependent peptidase [Flavihumibacter rivuli]|uniref:M90 family metallopeptidase n=1 Tax=Flavihumibacter rivuli TaxID=2838156 RepID=UPI001BDE41D2|nr:M90 family metallopeptidase [Flavihumibacter rivuli]ULQ55328.1 zinc-dependent peptidase [Flavihumibacter rivuli]
MFGLVFFAVVIIAVFHWRSQKEQQQRDTPIPENLEGILEGEVTYYRSLSTAEQERFRASVISFLRHTRIEGVGTEIDTTDRVLVAASAVIPIFGFPDWEYRNLTDVIIYDDHFNESFQAEGRDRQFMGMVGSGYLNGKMLLSKPALREGFSNKTDKHNTAIHEFVHLLDKADGAVDGIPEALLAKQYSIPWLDLVHRKINDILADRSDIDPYGATNKAEFFAVAAEYFFERPDLLRTKHPKLFDMMEMIFRQDPTRHSPKSPQ